MVPPSDRTIVATHGDNEQRRRITRPARVIGALTRGFDGVWRDNAGRAVRVSQRLLSGHYLNLVEPSPDDFEDIDVAIGLSREPRWNGHTHGVNIYSVAQHSLFVLEIVCYRRPRASIELQLAALLHDSEEGLGVKDIITPFKAILGSVYAEVSAGLQQAIHLKYGLPWPLPQLWKKFVKKADRIAAATEALHIAGFLEKEIRDRRKGLSNQNEILPRDDRWWPYLDPWPPDAAQQHFLTKLQHLKQAMENSKRSRPQHSPARRVR